jgi:hypothetical protein
VSRIGYDAVNWQAIPGDAQFVFGYVDGAESQWPPEAWTHFQQTNTPYATIAVDPAHDANVLDCEPGNPVNPQVNPHDAVPWAQRQANPVIYCSAGNLPAMIAAFDAAEATQPLYSVCDDTGVPHQYTYPNVTIINTQWQIGNSVDNDLVADYWPGIDPDPTPAPPPQQQEYDMTMTVPSVSGVAGLSWSQGSAQDLQFITDGSLGPAPQLRIVLLLSTGPFVLGANGWSQGRIVVPIGNYVPAANCFGAIIEAQTNQATPFWAYSNGT